MHRGLVALSSSAIAVVYFAGYLTTRGADAELADATATAAPTTPASTASAARVASARPGDPTAASPTAVSSGYRDGTYAGTGSNRRGDVSVEVTIQGGRITNVTITDATTQYPVSRIAALPGQVVARQSARVNRVTGATYSMLAFQQAVQQALAQAQVGAPAISVAGQPTDTPLLPAQTGRPRQRDPGQRHERGRHEQGGDD